MHLQTHEHLTMIHLGAVLPVIDLGLFAVHPHEPRETLALLVGTLSPVHARYIALRVLSDALQRARLLQF